MRRDLSAALLLSAGVALAAPFEPRLLRARNIVDEIQESYDFVVVGGGLAGLVLGARLSEDSNHTVLVLESGGTGDDLRDRIDTPGYTYYQSLWPTALNWAFQTTPQAGAGDRQLVWPRGKVLGGSSAINGLYMNRPGEIEINAWKDMLGNMDGADNWSWDSFYAALKKSETFTPPSDAVAEEGGITWTSSSHGTSGPIHMSYPGYTFPQVGQWSQAMQTVGIANSHDTYGGQNWGAYVATSAINPTNWTRSYSRSGYLDPLPPRPNYDVLANAHVTRVLFDSSSPKANLTANAVEYTRDGGQTKLTVKVNKEVILAGGTVGSPAVLLYSGVGPKDVLSAAGVPLVSELPGVGQHLQDHLSVSVQWSTDQPTAGSIYAGDGPEKNDPVFLSFVNSATGYVNATAIFGAGVSEFQNGINGQVDQFTPKASSGATVVAGYKSIYSVTANKILTSPIGQIELLLATNAAGAIRITAALQHPFSHGQIYINSSNPMDYPVIDPNYLAHPADYTILREGLKLARRLGEADPLKNSMTAETAPGPDVQSDAQWEDWLRTQIGTEFHPSSTCAMLPLAQGGVVDANLRVYGLANVRVADASVPPIVFSAHLMGSTYALAEQASSLIRGFYNGVPSTGSSGGTTGGGSGDNASDGTGSASTSRPWTFSMALVALFAVKFLL
ncbi:putative glucose-methanol-choline oxidoreductase [Exidia glandulosa HHB12029]|uniref:Putative glucose-methanol-choline oxidoreductase n=1 Tax=Exidia glandulosa HHB12029 TaxID=1314781 RepID=A0A166BLF8_EXIGL|nr:putative glucose-methanol-choline oxidoreductase [Exidia glandulosa HHB12029]